MTSSRPVSAIRPAKPRGPVIIREAEPDDLDAIADLQSRAIMAFGVDVYGREATEAWAKIGVQLRHSLLAGGRFFVAERDGRIVGVAGWTEDSREPDCAWARYVFVTPAEARRGLGRRLMTTVEASVQAAGRSRMQVWASLNALAFYRALGYRAVKPVRWPLAEGIELACRLMTKTLVL